jgi:hypothetical protein
MEAAQHTLEIALDVARTAGTHIDYQTRGLNTMAAQAGITGLNNNVQLQRLVDGFFEQLGGYNMVFIADARGTSVVAVPEVGSDGKRNVGYNYSDRPYFREVQQTLQTVVSGVEIGRRTRKSSLHIIVPLAPSNGKLHGFIAGSVDLASVWTLLKACLANAKGADAVIVDEHSQVVVDTRALPAKTMTDFSHSALLHWSPAREPRMASDKHGVMMRAVSVPVESQYVHWSVVVFRPEAYTQVAAATLRRSTFIISALALLGALAVAYWSAHRIASPSYGKRRSW